MLKAVKGVLRRRFKDKAGGDVSGTVMFIVLVFIITVTTLILVSSIRFRSEVGFIENEMARLKAYAGCISGMEYLKSRLLTTFPGQAEFVDSSMRPLPVRLRLDGRDFGLSFLDIIPPKYSKKIPLPDLDEPVFYLSLQDSAGLLNFFKIDKELFKNFLRRHGVPKKETDSIIDALNDWMDKDDFARPAGAEKKFYLDHQMEPPSNRLLGSNEELLMVRGFDKELYNAIGPLLDFSIEHQGLNPNTMPPELFYLFNGIGPDHIERILESREKQPIIAASQLDLIAGYPFSTHSGVFQFFTSDTTYVKIRGHMNENRFFYVTFKMQRMAGGGSMRRGRRIIDPLATTKDPAENFDNYYHTLSWKEGTDLDPDLSREYSQEPASPIPPLEIDFTDYADDYPGDDSPDFSDD